MSSNHTFSNVAYERYALALYELAKEKSELDKTEIEANNINQLINSCGEFKNMISNPTIGHKEQSAAVLKIADIYNFSSTFKKFLGFLTSKRRLFFLDKIIENFLNLISKNKGELKAYLFSSKKLLQQEVDYWLKYELPRNLIEKIWQGKYKGQKQKWFIMKFLGNDSDININTKKPEFVKWKWINHLELPNVVVNFKLKIYEKLTKEVSFLSI